jgi:DivIVA domain-containing protein
LAKEPEQPPLRASTRTRVPDAEIAELRDVRFGSGLRGYDRGEVDTFVGHVRDADGGLDGREGVRSDDRCCPGQGIEEARLAAVRQAN